MTAVNPVWLWVVLTVASVAVGGAMLWVAFAVVNRRERQRRGFEMKMTAGGGVQPALREKENDHG